MKVTGLPRSRSGLFSNGELIYTMSGKHHPGKIMWTSVQSMIQLYTPAHYFRTDVDNYQHGWFPRHRINRLSLCTPSAAGGCRILKNLLMCLGSAYRASASLLAWRNIRRDVTNLVLKTSEYIEAYCRKTSIFQALALNVAHHQVSFTDHFRHALESAFRSRAVKLATRVQDGFISCSTISYTLSAHHIPVWRSQLMQS